MKLLIPADGQVASLLATNEQPAPAVMGSAAVALKS